MTFASVFLNSCMHIDFFIKDETSVIYLRSLAIFCYQKFEIRTLKFDIRRRLAMPILSNVQALNSVRHQTRLINSSIMQSLTKDVSVGIETVFIKSNPISITQENTDKLIFIVERSAREDAMGSRRWKMVRF